MLSRITKGLLRPQFKFCSASDPKSNAQPIVQRSAPKLWQKTIPQRFHPYIYLGRYDKPIGYLLLYWPCAWGLALCTPIPSVFDFGVFLAGSIALRAAGCIVNDIADKQFDKDVERTKSRPLANGDLTVKQALTLLIPNLSVGLVVLTQLPWNAIAASFGILPIVCIYPLMKRYTNYPQLVLGVAFNWGVIVGYLARSSVFEPTIALPVYFAGICWTLIYDTVYAYQDIRDDQRIGVKSTAIAWKDNYRTVFQRLLILSYACFVYTGVAANFGVDYMAAAFVAHLAWKYRINKLDINNREDCGKMFRQSSYFGIAMLLAILVGNRESQETKRQQDELLKAIDMTPPPPRQKQFKIPPTQPTTVPTQ